jgi:hypothetical protein
VDARNLLHSKGTYWIIRGEHLVILAVCSALVLWHAGEVHWWRAIAAFWIIDLVGYLPGAVAFVRAKGEKINPWFHHAYNIAHTYLVTGTGVALWAYFLGDYEWAMLAVPIHLAVDRGVFGNILKPVGLSFEPRDHSDDVILRALGRYDNSGSEKTDSGTGRKNLEDVLPREVLTEVLEHPSGYLALSKRNPSTRPGSWTTLAHSPPKIGCVPGRSRCAIPRSSCLPAAASR